MPPRAELVRALGLFEPSVRKTALDVGCGPGREVVLLLQHGFKVVALDPYASMLEQTAAAVAGERSLDGAFLTLHHATAEQFASQLSAGQFGLVHAGFVLPFVRSADLSRVMPTLLSCLEPGGLFVAQFFGHDDDFIVHAAPNTMSAHTDSELSGLFEGFEFLHREEVNRLGHIGRGASKRWHVHHIIARKPHLK